MREKLTKALKIALAALLVFLVAAPLIVGVYDAAKGRDTSGSLGTGASGSIVHVSGGTTELRDQGNVAGLRNGLSGADDDGQALYGRSSEDTPRVYSELSNSRSSESSGDGSRSIQEDFGSGDIEPDMAAGDYSVSDWYSGDPVVSDLLGSGDAHLAYKFADGSVVDFGNPYILDWVDVPKPDDYDEVANGSLEESLFTPEKAYAGPVSSIVAKLKMLAIKSGYWKSFNSMLYSFAITVAMSSGMTYTAATQCVNKIVAELPAITRVITSETAAFTTEDTAMLISNSIARVAARKVAASEFPAALNAEIAANVTAVETTGMLAGGASGNFINAMYQLAATGGVPASILYSDIGLYIGSWLGGEFDDYFSDLPDASNSETFQLANGLGVFNVVVCSNDVLPDSAIDQSSYATWYSAYVPDGGFYLCGGNLKPGSIDVATVWDGYTVLGNYGYRPGDTKATFLSGVSGYRLSDVQTVYISDTTTLTLWDRAGVFGSSGYHITVYDQSSGFNTDIGTVFGGSLQPFDGQIVGQDAAYDDAGNVTDYGNVTVPNVSADGYVAPNTYAEALSQMNATATTENPAHADSPSFGQTDAMIKDWVDANQTPEPEPPGDASKDDFKIQDLETVFPFCIPWDVYYLISAVAAEPVAPVIDFPLNFSNFGLDDYELTVDFGDYNDFAVVIRAVEALSFCVGLALVTRNLIRG